MPAWLDRALALAHRGSAAAAVAGGALLIASAMLVSVEVVLRRCCSITLGGADELSGYTLAISSTWSFAFVLLNRGNVRIDVLYQHLPRRLAALCDLLAMGALLGFGGLVAWHGAGVLAQSWRLDAHSNSALGVPLVWPQLLWWSGYAWFMACGLLLSARGLWAFVAGDWDTVNRLMGARTVEEDAADELQTARAGATGPQPGPAR